MSNAATAKPVTKVPSRLEPLGKSGWTVFEFASANDAAAFVKAYPECRMPCWARFDVVEGALLLAR